MKNRLGDWLNSFFSWFIVSAAKSPNSEEDKTGGLNKIFGYVYQIRLIGKKLKAFNSNLYYLVKDALFGLILYLILF